MESKKQRFAKGSEEAKAYMSELRAKRKGNKGGSNTPPPAAPVCAGSTTFPGCSSRFFMVCSILVMLFRGTLADGAGVMGDGGVEPPPSLPSKST